MYREKERESQKEEGSWGQGGRKDLKRHYRGNEGWVHFSNMSVAVWQKEEQVTRTIEATKTQHRYKKKTGFVNMQAPQHLSVKAMLERSLGRLVPDHRGAWCMLRGGRMGSHQPASKRKEQDQDCDLERSLWWQHRGWLVVWNKRPLLWSRSGMRKTP